MTNAKRQSNISGKYRKKIERSKKEEQEYGAGSKDIVICEDCSAVYYYKSWHHSLGKYKHLSEDKAVQFALCPACQMIRDNKFEGQVVFENVPKAHRKEIINNIKNTGERAYKRDPMDRIIKITEGGDTIEVLTTENQLARNIARQIERAYKNFKTDINWSGEESVARVVVKFAKVAHEGKR